MALPWVGTWIGWPWIYIDGNGPAASIGFDLVLVAFFGVVHSALAGRAGRRTYVVVAGLVSFFFMALWQPTGVILYQLLPSALGASLLSFFVYWGLLLAGARTLAQVESPARFLGLDRSTSSEKRTLWTGGLYGKVRHPLYLFTFAAWILAPMMSLDRLVFIVGMGIYVAIGVRREERRMRTEFGPAYDAYLARTARFVPLKTKKAIAEV
ncbi:MAG: hypothetical protein JST04_04225 [Bdellovibrionales bacterium]|nr:hypothetical protein [Bdellovibrionales bacterium]